jgi:hypothetical protein
MKIDDWSANWKRWKMPTLFFVLGAVVGGTFLTSSLSSFWLKVPWPFQWLLIPGFVFLAPAYVVAGGVHGDHVEIVFRLVPLANGAAYALMVMAFRRVFRRGEANRIDTAR